MTKKIATADLTPWFPVAIPPARPGVYQVEWVDCRPVHAKYARGIWHYGSHKGVDRAGAVTGSNPARPPLRWRGLAADPKVAK